MDRTGRPELHCLHRQLSIAMTDSNFLCSAVKDRPQRKCLFDPAVASSEAPLFFDVDKCRSLSSIGMFLVHVAKACQSPINAFIRRR